jgi:hypothetical protein
MAVQSNPYLVLTDGTDTVTFADGAGGQTGYPLVARTWAPAIAAQKRSSLGGVTPYDPVAETIQINIVSTVSAADCYAKLAVLTRLLDKADRWWLKMDNISPVTLKFAPQGSTIASNATPYQALILGRAPNDETSGVQLPVVYDQSGMIWQIFNVTLAFVRRGLWTGASENASAAAVANPAVLSVTMPSTPNTVGPLELDFTGFTTLAATGDINIPNAYGFLGPVAAFSLQQGESSPSQFLATNATYASTADAAARASAGSVGRIDHHLCGLGSVSRILWTLPAAFLSSTRIAIYCTYRNNSATAWTIQGEAYRTTPMSVGATTAPVQAIVAGASNPTVLFLGIIGSAVGFDTAGIRLAITALSGAATLDIDTILFVDVSNPRVYALALAGVVSVLGAAFASKNVSVIIDNNPNAREVPFVHTDVLTTAAVLTPGYTGDAGLVSFDGTIGVIWYAPHTTFWTTSNIAGSATLNIGATITRRLGYLVPE